MAINQIMALNRAIALLRKDTSNPNLNWDATDDEKAAQKLEAVRDNLNNR